MAEWARPDLTVMRMGEVFDEERGQGIVFSFLGAGGVCVVSKGQLSSTRG